MPEFPAFDIDDLVDEQIAAIDQQVAQAAQNTTAQEANLLGSQATDQNAAQDQNVNTNANAESGDAQGGTNLADASGGNGQGGQGGQNANVADEGIAIAFDQDSSADGQGGDGGNVTQDASADSGDVAQDVGVEALAGQELSSVSDFVQGLSQSNESEQNPENETEVDNINDSENVAEDLEDSNVGDSDDDNIDAANSGDDADIFA